MDIFGNLVVITICLVISLLVAVLGKSESGFSINLFLGAFSICIMIFIWYGTFSKLLIIIPAICIVIILFSEKILPMRG